MLNPTVGGNDMGASQRMMSKNGASLRKGSSLIEFTFLLLPLLGLIFGSVEMDRMLLAYNSVGESARAGVRYAAVHGWYATGTGTCTSANTTDVINVVKTFAGMGILNPNLVNATVTCANRNVGSVVSIAVSYPYDPFTSFFPLSVTLTTVASGTFAF